MKKLSLTDILTSDVTTVRPDCKMDQALTMMRKQKISAIVVTKDQYPVGIFTERDAVRIVDRCDDPAMLDIGEAMSQPVFSVSAEMEYREAYNLIAEHGFRHLVVTDADGKLAGIVSEGDFMKNLGMKFLLHVKEVGALMTKEVQILSPDVKVKDAVSLMERRRLSCIVIVENNIPVGMLTERDIVKMAISPKKMLLTPLSDVMSHPVTTVHPEMPIPKAMQVMDKGNFRRVVVADEDGYTVGLLTRHDIVKQLYNRHVELLEESLRENEDRLKTVTEELDKERGLHVIESRLTESQRLARIGSWEFDLVTNEIWWSEETYRIFEIDPKQFDASYEAFLNLIHPDDRELVNNAYKDSVENKTSYSIVHRLCFDDGRIKYVNERSNSYYDETGKPLHSIGTVQDITEQYHQDEKIERYHAMLTALVEGSTDPIFVKDKEGRYIVSNSALSKLIDRPIGKIIGADDFALFPPELAEQFRADDQRFMQEKQVQTYVESIILEDKVIPYQTTKGPILINGHVQGVFGIARDISVLKETETQLKENEKRLNQLLNTLPYGVQENNLEGVITYSNPAHHRILGVTEGTMTGRYIWDFMASDEEKEKLRDYLSYLVAEQTSPKPYISNIITMEGRSIQLEISWDYQRDSTGKITGFISVISDVTERRQDEEELRQNTWFLESLDTVSRTLAGIHDSVELLQSLSELVSEMFHVDRAWFLYPCNPEAPEYAVLAETTRNGFEGAYDANLKIPMDDHSAGVFVHALSMDSPLVIQVDQLEEVPDFVREFEIQSQMVTVLRPQLGDAWLMGVHQCSAKREWKEIDVKLFNAIAERISLVLSSSLLLKKFEDNEKVLLEAEHTAKVGHWELDIDSGIAQWSESMYPMMGVDPSTEVGPKFLSTIVNNEDLQDLENSFDAAIRTGKMHEAEYRVKKSNGEETWIYCRADRKVGNEKKNPKLVGIVQDITERKNKEQALQLSGAVFDNTSEGIMITDANVNIISVNAAFTNITGYSEAEAKGHNPRLLQSNKQDRVFYDQMWHTLKIAGSWQGEIWNRRKNGEIYPEWLSLGIVKDKQDNVLNYIGLFSDITNVKKSEEEFRFLATHDPLTKLPNRMLLNEQLDYALKRMQRHGVYMAVLYLDIDRFKEVNDSLGHPAGDQLLEIIAERFKEVLREEDFVARVSGDEFVIILEEIKRANDAGRIAEDILHLIRQPMYIDKHEVTVTASIGIAISPTDGDSNVSLLKNADSALYRAKEQGRNTYSYYSEELAAKNFELMYLHNALYNALDNEEFVIYYQPQVNMRTGAVIGMEALVRWNSPEMGLVSPGRFIPVAEETGLIISLGEWVLRQACMQMKQWKAADLPMQYIAINLSARQLSQEQIVQTVQGVLNDTGINPECVELEITESAVMQVEDNISKLNALKALGIRISIDDFGTGYSSLARLKGMPIDKLKIDQSFVSGIPDEDGSVKITDVIIQLAKSLNIDVIAEGVETEIQGEYLMKKGCENAQGFFYSRPQPPKKIEAWLKCRKK